MHEIGHQLYKIMFKDKSYRRSPRVLEEKVKCKEGGYFFVQTWIKAQPKYIRKSYRETLREYIRCLKENPFSD